MTADRTASQANKDVVRQWVDRMVNRGDLDAADELCAPILAESARRWVASFRTAFPDVHMREVTLIAEDDQVVGQYTCSATHLGQWLGRPATGRRFDNVDEAYFFRLLDGRIVDLWGLEDTHERLRQLGLT